MAEDAGAKTILGIAVAAGGTECVHGDQHARAGDIAIANGVAQANVEEVAGADVTDGGEACHQGDACVDAGVESLLGDSFLQGVEASLLVVVGIGKGEMRVGINEAGEQRGIAKFDDLRAGGNGGVGADGSDFSAGDDDQTWRNDGIAFTIKEPSCLQDVSLVGRFLSLSHSRRPQHQAAEKTAQKLAAHARLLCSSTRRGEGDCIVVAAKVNRRGKSGPRRRTALGRLAMRKKGFVGGVPKIRIRQVNSAAIRTAGDYVLYWMIANRRLHFNFALDRALEHCAALKKPLVIFEALRIGYRWASDRMHRFVIDGMADNARTCEARGVCYYPYVEPTAGAGKGLLEALAENACVVVTDEYPCFFLPRMVESAGKRLAVSLEAVDSNGLLPIYACEQVMGRAFDFRRFLQKELPKHLADFPAADPLGKAKLPAAVRLPGKIRKNWPVASAALLSGDPAQLKLLPIDHGVRPVELRGGHSHAKRHMMEFFERKLADYGEKRNEPELDVASGLSPFLHFGHLSVHEVFAELARREKWKPEKLVAAGDGKPRGLVEHERQRGEFSRRDYYLARSGL